VFERSKTESFHIPSKSDALLTQVPPRLGYHSLVCDNGRGIKAGLATPEAVRAITLSM